MNARVGSGNTSEAMDDCRIRVNERRLIALMTGLQFVDALEYQLVLPLAPDIASDLHFSLANIASLSGAYSLSAVLSSLAGIFWLDRINRRTALFGVTLGLLLSTALTALSPSFWVLLCARFSAGIFGGLVASLIPVVLAESLPLSRRGRAFGTIMTSVVIAAMVGVPACLQLALVSSWRLPFLLTAAAGFMLTIAIRGGLSNCQTFDEPQDASVLSWKRLFGLPAMLSYGLIVSGTLGGALLVPNLSVYIQHNLHFPRGELGALYMIGATSSFIALQLAGHLIDRIGTLTIVFIGHAISIATITVAFIFPVPHIPVWIWFTAWNASLAASGVCTSSFLAGVPEPGERGAFMSALTGIRHATVVAASLIVIEVLGVNADGSLRHTNILGIVSAVCMLLPPLIVAVLIRH